MTFNLKCTSPFTLKVIMSQTNIMHVALTAVYFFGGGGVCFLVINLDIYKYMKTILMSQTNHRKLVDGSVSVALHVSHAAQYASKCLV